MNPLNIVILSAVAMLASSCVTGIKPAKVAKNAFQENGITAYIPPQGNPKSEYSWNFYGPGAIVRQNGNTTDYGARHIIGDGDVKQFFTNANAPVADRTTFGALSNVRTASTDFDASGGWTTAKVLDIKGKLGIHDSTTETVQFGETWVEQLTLQQIKQAPGISSVDEDIRLNLSQGKSQLVQKLIYSDGITIHLNKKSDTSGEVAIKIPTQQEEKLGGGYHVTNDGGVQVKGPVMVGYVAVDKSDAARIFPLKK